jgi:hypothetical protein
VEQLPRGDFNTWSTSSTTIEPEVESSPALSAALTFGNELLNDIQPKGILTDSYSGLDLWNSVTQLNVPNDERHEQQPDLRAPLNDILGGETYFPSYMEPSYHVARLTPNQYSQTLLAESISQPPSTISRQMHPGPNQDDTGPSHEKHLGMSSNVLGSFLMADDDELDQGLCTEIIEGRIKLVDVIRAGVRTLASSLRPSQKITPAREHGPCCEVDSMNGRDSPHASQAPNLSTFRNPRGRGSHVDLHLNHIRVNRYCFVAACLANAPLIGVSPEKACGPNSSSPFYLPYTPEGDIGHTIAKFSNLKEDLRPCGPQICIDHRVYIDLLPFPVFRERVLALLASAPHILNEAGLSEDLDNDGLVCWGSSAQSGSGASWDRRSWEAKPWFLKKWWMLTGGEDGEMYRQAKWWREMRGQKSDV